MHMAHTRGADTCQLMAFCKGSPASTPPTTVKCAMSSTLAGPEHHHPTEPLPAG